MNQKTLQLYRQWNDLLKEIEVLETRELMKFASFIHPNDPIVDVLIERLESFMEE